MAMSSTGSVRSAPAADAGEGLGVRSNLAELLALQAQRQGTAPALRHERWGALQTSSWAQVDHRVSALARGLGALGFAEGSVLLAAGALTPEWLWSVLAVHRLGGSVLPLADVDDAAWRHALDHTRVRYVYALGASEVARVLAARAQLATEPVVIHVEPLEPHTACDLSLFSLDAVRRLGAGAAARAIAFAKDASDVLAPAFLAFERREDGLVERKVAHHCGLIRDALRELTPRADVEPPPDAARCNGSKNLTWLARWLLCGAPLSLREGPAPRA